MEEKSDRRTRPGNGNQQQVNDASKSQISPPSISLPKGGGAIRGMGEKFAANPVNGTGSLTVPIATSPGRSGFGPQLSLSYDSGAGNGLFGLGWNLGLPSITRKTEKGLPRYRDSDDPDEFILSGAEDLVPEYEKDANGNWVIENGKHVIHEKSRTVDGETYEVRRYRPRIEGLFARIERWTNQGKPEETFWRSISKDNITTWYGKTEESRILDPADPTRIFSWLICESYDDKGNVLVYRYKPEDSVNVVLSHVHEANRTVQSRSANRYLKRIRYGNRAPYFPELKSDEDWPSPPGANAQDGSQDWFFEVVLDYGEHDASAPEPNDSTGWSYRLDPFSSYRAGFEVRTYRLCQRVLMFHHFPGEAGVEANCLVRSTDFTYRYEQDPQDHRNPIHSVVTSVSQCGYKRHGAGYLKRSLPPLEFEYSEVNIHDEVTEVDSESLENLPYGLDNGRYQWVDLDGEGLSGILTQQGRGLFYKTNLSPINVRKENGKEISNARFGSLERVAEQPSLTALGGVQQLLDLAGDGQLDLVELERPTPGFYERTHDERWETFRAFESVPTLDWENPNLKFVDLTGDGHADIFISEDEAFCWHPSLAEAGFGPPETVRKAVDEEKGPRVVFADGTQSIYLADISGDGLTDLVRIRNGEVCYWPNLGYGHFGAKVTMDNAPWFDAPDQFDQRRIRLADIDGSGVTDIIYLGRNGVHIYYNQSGNSWSDARTLVAFPQVDNLSAVTAIDLLGNGTACLVWSSPLPGHTRRPVRYIDLMGGQKPHLLVKSVNNLGAETHVQYAPSTKFYLEDKLAGQPWITKLPFPVHVVERVETNDQISRNRFVTRYAYHHGYFDGEERDFRGFGRVDQWDTEQFATLTEMGELPEASNLDPASHVPPVLTRTWFHTGTYVGRNHVSNFFAGLLDEKDLGEYYREPGLGDEEAKKLLLPDTILPGELTVAEEREACRALKGSMLRQEVYALDGTGDEDYPHGHPYTVTEQNFTIRRIQPKDKNRHAVFFAHPREAINYHYERKPEDPRIQHALTLEVDDFGNVLRSVAVGYPRSNVSEREPEQAETHITLTVDRFINRDDELDWYRVGLAAESRTYEVVKPPSATQRFTWEELRNLLTSVFPLDQNEPLPQKTIPYEEWDWRKQWNPQIEPGGLVNTRLRLVEQARTLYRKDDLTAFSPLGEVEPLALPGETYKLAFTQGLLTQVYQRNGQPLLPDPADVLGGHGSDRGGYVDLDNNGHWWIPSGRVFLHQDSSASPAQEQAYARQHFFLLHRFRDPFGNDTLVSYDKDANDNPYDLLVSSTQDALGNEVTAQHDYRVLQPRLITDPNGNRSEVAFDALGMVVGTAVMGKSGETPAKGDWLDSNFIADLTADEIEAFYDANDPHAPAPDLLKDATTRIIYDLDQFHRTQQAHPEDPTQWRPVFAATLARETHFSDPLPPQGLKIQISFSYSDGFGREIQKKIQAEPGSIEENVPMVDPRWVGSGWTIFNNKGKPVRQYEPFFDDTHGFKFGKQVGVSPILFYDPVERVVATLHPNHTYEKVVFDPWRQETWDVNDTVALDPRTDSHVSAIAAAYFQEQPNNWQTWLQQRGVDPQNPPPDSPQLTPEEKAAVRTLNHAATPTVAHFDTLGRPFLTVAHNRVNSVDELYRSRIELDIESNQREVIDAKGRVVMRYDYDILGNRVHQASMEAGERWMLDDVAGSPIRAWDSRGHEFKTEYDELRRPFRRFVKGTDASHSDPRTLGNDILFEKIEYGEGQANDAALNLRTLVFKQFDGAGIVTNDSYDFKGNLLHSSRELAQDYKAIVDWAAAQPPGEIFSSSTTYDALNRPVTITSPDGSVARPQFNEANLLDSVAVRLRGANNQEKPFVANIDYNAKGQSTGIDYGSGVRTTYEYDPETFRLIHLKTTRQAGPNGVASQIFADPAVVQDLRFTYDPAGNITSIEDAALRTISHDNELIEPVCSYTYDALYRLVEAKGREHIGETAFRPSPLNGNFRDFPFAGLNANPNDLQSLRNYTERYEYDPVGNFEKLIHQFANGAWIRGYKYDEPSLLEPTTKQSNRLSNTTVGQTIETYSYDAHGNIINMPHIQQMKWDFEDQLHEVDLGGGGTAYYVYDAGGQRARKVVEKNYGSLIEERIYLGGYEICRERQSASLALERETLHIMDDQKRVALVETKTVDTQHPTPNPQSLIRYQFGNHLGSACLELDAAGEIISYEEYDPYGTTSYQAGPNAAEISLKRYRYTGKERDEETGLYYHGARYYACWLGRWTAADPAGMADGTNMYAYAKRNPIRLMDPNGMQPKEKPEPGASHSRPTGKTTPRWTERRIAAVRLASQVLNRAVAAKTTINDYLLNNPQMTLDQVKATLALLDYYQSIEQAAVLTMKALGVKMVDREGPVALQARPTRNEVLRQRWAAFNRRADALKSSIAAGPLIVAAEVKAQVVYGQSMTADDMDAILAAAAVVDAAIAIWAFRRAITARKHGKAEGARGGAESAEEHTRMRQKEQNVAPHTGRRSGPFIAPEGRPFGTMSEYIRFELEVQRFLLGRPLTPKEARAAAAAARLRYHYPP